MSYASSDKNSPNPLKRLPQKLAQPTAIAVIASVAIHAALGLSLPYLPLSSKEKPKPVRNVQLLDLKPEELSRLPPSPLPLEPLPPSLNQQLKPLSPSSPSGSSSLRGLPSLPSNDPSLSNLPSLDPLPSLGGSSWKISKRSPNLGKFDIRNSSLRNDLKLKQTKEPPLPSEVFNSKTGKSSTNPQFKIATGSKISNSPNLRRDLGGLTRGLVPANDEPSLPGTYNSNQTSGLLPPPPPPGAIAANPGLIGSQLPNQFGAPTSTQSPAQTTQAAAPTVGQTNLTDNTATRNFNAFVQNGEDWKKRHQVSGEPEELPITVGKYPQKARAAGVDRGSVQVNWKVDKNGNIIPDSLEVIGSSEGGVFDEEALSAVRKLPIQVTGQEKAYTVRVIFFDDSKAPTSATGSSTSPSEGKNPTERQNSSQRLTPAEQLTPSERVTPPMQLTPPERQNSIQWSTPNERQIPSLRQNLLEPSTPIQGKTPAERVVPIERSTPTQEKKPAQQLTPTQGNKPTEQLTPTQGKTPTEKTPSERVTPSDRSTPTQEKKPAERVVPMERLTPTQEKKPAEKTPSERVVPIERSTPSEGKKPAERVTPSERVTPNERQNSSERSTSTERQTPAERQDSSERQTPAERRNSPETRSSSESQNSEKPQKLPEAQSSEKPQRLPTPPNPAKP